jgi:hypothetical protein
MEKAGKTAQEIIERLNDSQHVLKDWRNDLPDRTGSLGQLPAPVTSSPKGTQWVPSNFPSCNCRIG